jgi:solute carrier family 25 phosphate transporter 23/24/25/41
MNSQTGHEASVCTCIKLNPEPQLTQPLQPLAPDLTALERIRQTFAQPVLASFVAGGVAGAVSRTVVSPLERLKILFQIQSVGREEYKMSVPKALAKMWREEGWRGFMAGNGTNCIRIVPYSAVQFSAYNVYKRVSSPSLVLR